ncbi:MAG TPA: hypothetical protein VL172_05340 [Kofleriaceae bacterium]|nr:hypothetical protein [Kofleriaceae bacterium]
MKRICVLFVCLAPLLVACGGGDDAPGVCEDDGGEACFVPPAAAMTVTPVGESPHAPNLACAPFEVGTIASAVEVTGVLKDYVTGDPSANGTADAFFDGVPAETGDMHIVAGADGSYAFTLEAGTPTMLTVRTRAATDAVDVIGYRFKVNDDQATRMIDASTLSSNSFDQIEGLVGLVRDPANGAAIVAASDCDRVGIENVIGALSSTSSADGSDPTFVAGYTFYGASGDFPVPVRRNVSEASADNGIIFSLSVPPGTYYAQVWGFLTEADVAAGRDGLTLVSEIELVVAANTASGVFLEPTEGPL